MEVQLLQGVQQALALQGFHRLQQLLGVEAELGVVAGGAFPLAAAHRVELEAQAEQGLDFQFLGHLEDERQLGHLFHGDQHVAPGLARQQRHPDEGLVLVAVAGDQGFRVQVHAQGDHQLRLGAGFQAVAVLVAGFADLVDDLLHLVALDRVDALVAAFVFVFHHGLAEGLVQFRDPRREDLRKAQDQRRVDALLAQMLDDLEDVAAQVLVPGRMDFKMALAVHPEEAIAPLFDAVHGAGVLDREILDGHRCVLQCQPIEATV